MITAHGGSLNTERNSYEYFEAVANCGMDAIEVDIRSVGGKLYLGHLIVPLFKSKRIPLEYVFEYCKEHRLKVNCDVKKGGLVAPVAKLAADMNATQYVYFTGSVKGEEIASLGGCEAYMNNGFYPFSLKEENLEKIKKYLDSFSSPRIRGLNVNYLFTPESLRDAVVAAGMGLSVYTVDNEEELRKIVNKGYDNVTTNKPDKALAFMENGV